MRFELLINSNKELYLFKICFGSKLKGFPLIFFINFTVSYTLLILTFKAYINKSVTL